MGFYRLVATPVNSGESNSSDYYSRDKIADLIYEGESVAHTELNSEEISTVTSEAHKLGVLVDCLGS